MPPEKLVQSRKPESPISEALQVLVDPRWHQHAAGDYACPKHIFVSAAGASDLEAGAADRLRGVYIGALASALTARQLHVDPALLGPLHTQPRGTFEELLANVTRLVSGRFCSGNTHVRRLDATFHDPQHCAASTVLQQALQSQAAIVVLSSNCFSLPTPALSEAAPSQPHRAALGALLRCDGHVPALYLNGSSQRSAEHSNLEKLQVQDALREARRGCPTAAAAARGSAFPDWMRPGPPLRQRSIPPLHLASCGALPRSVACSTTILRHVWFLRCPRVVAVLAAAERLHQAWAGTLAPLGYTVLHLRAAQNDMQLGPRCTLPSVPWADPVPPSWAAQAVGEAWLQQLAAGLPAAPAQQSQDPQAVPTVVVLSDSARLRERVERLLAGSARVLSPCCAQPVHSGRMGGVQGGAADARAVAAARQLVFDWVTIARANVLVHGRGMFWSAGVFWDGWEQGPVLVEAWAPQQVAAAARLLLQPWPKK